MLWARPSHMGVVEVAVYGFGVVAAGEEAFEVGISGRDGAEVLGPVQLAGRVLLVAVESHGDRRAVVVSGELVVVVPALAPSLVLVALGADAGEGDEVQVAGGGVFADAECSAAGEERDGVGGAVGERDALVFEVDALLDSLAIASSRLLRSSLGGSHPVDGE